MKAFKSVLEFAAKDQTTPDSQREWMKWKDERQNSKDESVEFEPRKRVEIEKEDDWIELADKNGSKYYVNKVTGETTSNKPPSNQIPDGSDEEERSSSESESDDKADPKANQFEGATTEVDPNRAKKIEFPPQTWEKRLNSLTRKTTWYCAEIDATVENSPPEHPWRAVKLPTGQVYLWNTETNATKWL